MQRALCDVTISVWNDFWSPQLVSGLHNAGFQVTHHTTACQKTPCARFIRNMSASALNHLAFRGVLPSRFAHSWSRRLVDSKSGRLARESKAFWGWSGCSLRGLNASKSAGKPSILERGSTHCVWNGNRVSAIYNKLGLPLDEIADSDEIQYDLQEYESADRICVPSNFVYKTFLENGIQSERLFLNPYGVDFEFWSSGDSNPRKELLPFTFLWVASLMPRKGITVLLEAWRKAHLKDARLVLVGGASKSIRPLLSKLPSGVVLHSFLDHIAIRTLMAQSHVYVLPSFEEGMARSVLEAGAAGLPVLITEETGATDIFKDGRDGWVVQSGDSDHLAEMLSHITKNRELCISMGVAAQNAVRPFTWDAYGKRAAQFLKGLLEN